MKVKYEINISGYTNIPENKIEELEHYINKKRSDTNYYVMISTDEIKIGIDKYKNLTFENFFDIIK